MKKNYFFGWANIKWLVKEIAAIYSSKKSYFSKKRIESGVAFVILQAGMVFWLYKKYVIMTTSDFFIWASIEAVIAGYTLNQIQKEKQIYQTQKVNSPENIEEDVDETDSNTQRDEDAV